MSKRALAAAAGLLSLLGSAALSGGCAGPTASGPIDPVRTYARGCALCHPLHSPGRYAGAAWRTAVACFGARAGLSRAEREAVLGYLVENASDGVGAAPTIGSRSREGGTGNR